MLDLHTLLAVKALLSIFLCAAMLTYWLTQKTSRGFGFWVACNTLLAATWLFDALRGIGPDWISILPASSLMALAAMFRLEGVRRFCGQAPMPWWKIALFPVAMAVFILIQLDNEPARTIGSAFAFGAICLLIARVLTQHAHPKQHSLHYAVAIFIGIQGLILFARATHCWLVPAACGLLGATPGNVAFGMAWIVGDVGLTIAYLMLNSSLMAEELRDTQPAANATLTGSRIAGKGTTGQDALLACDLNPPIAASDALAFPEEARAKTTFNIAEALAKLKDELGFTTDAAQLLLREYLQSARSTLEQTQRHIAARECEPAMRTTHAMRGAAANLRLPEMAMLLRDLEDACRTANWPAATALLAKTRHLLEAILQELPGNPKPLP